MELVNRLLYNDKEVKNIIFSNSNVSTLNVFPMEKQWKQKPSTPEFEPKIYFDNSYLGSLFKNTRGFSMNSGGAFIVEFNAKNVGSVNVTTQIWNYTRIDDWGIFIQRTPALGWEGGTPNNTFEGKVTLQASENITEKYTVSLYSSIDETPLDLINPGCPWKAFRIPASGIDNYTEIIEYPYDFASYDFAGYSNFSLYEKNKNWLIENTDYYSKDGIVIQTEDGESSIDTVLRYRFPANNSSNYKYFFIFAGCYLHILQEPRNINRVYYGSTALSDPYYYAKYDDDYHHKVSGSFRNVLFSIGNSKILSDSDINTTITLSKSYKSYAIANSSDYEVEVIDGHPDIISHRWGDMDYTIYSAVSTNAANTEFRTAHIKINKKGGNNG